MGILELFLGFLLLPLPQSFEQCLKPNGACYPSSTTDSCLQDPNGYNGHTMVAHGRLSDLDPTIRESRKIAIEEIVRSTETFIKTNISISKRMHPCFLWNLRPHERNQQLDVITDTLCRQSKKPVNPLPEGPSRDSLVTSEKLFCLPWDTTEAINILSENPQNSYCRNPTKSSLGPYCYISMNHTMPCFIKCESTIDFKGNFRSVKDATNYNETNCDAVCALYDMKCNFTNYDKLQQQDLKKLLKQQFINKNHNCDGLNQKTFGQDIDASKWNYPVYKVSTGCVYGYRSRTFAPDCDGNIENEDDYSRICMCVKTNDISINAKTTTITITFTSKNTSEPVNAGKSTNSVDQTDSSKTIPIIIGVVVGFVVLSIAIVAVLLVCKRTRSKRKRLADVERMKYQTSKRTSKRNSSINKIEDNLIQKNEKVYQPARLSEASPTEKQSQNLSPGQKRNSAPATSGTTSTVLSSFYPINSAIPKASQGCKTPGTVSKSGMPSKASTTKGCSDSGVYEEVAEPTFDLKLSKKDGRSVTMKTAQDSAVSKQKKQSLEK